MEAIKIKKKIRSSTLLIKELEKFKGREVEILILSENEKTVTPKLVKRKGKNAGGILEEYKNVKLLPYERSAWETAMREKHADN